jgi:hypothetical protein
VNKMLQALLQQGAAAVIKNFNHAKAGK